MQPCRVCNACIHDMDHHCPFINNCVGASNQRHFLLFLLFLLTGIFYVISLCVMLALERWEIVQDTWRLLDYRITGIKYLDYFFVTISFMLEAPGWLAATTYLVSLTMFRMFWM